MDPVTLLALGAGAILLLRPPGNAGAGGGGSGGGNSPGPGTGGGPPPSPAPDPAAREALLRAMWDGFKRWKTALEARKKAEGDAAAAWWNPFNPVAEDDAANRAKSEAILAHQRTIAAGPDNPILIDDKTVRQWLFEDASWQLWADFGLDDKAQAAVNLERFTLAFEKSLSKLKTNPPWNTLEVASYWIDKTAKVVGILLKGS